jgi:tetratricopeptide (TPR) repeat protein
MSSERQLGWTLVMLGRGAEARQVLEPLRARYQSMPGAAENRDAFGANYSLALAYMHEGETKRSLEMLRAGLEEQRRALGPDDTQVAQTEMSLGGLLVNMGNPPECGDLFRHAYRVLESNHGPESFNTMQARHQLGFQRIDYDPAEAEKILLDLLRDRRAILGERHAENSTTLMLLGRLANERGDLGRAEALYREALDIAETGGGVDHPSAMSSRARLAEIIARQGRTNEALQLARQNLLTAEKADRALSIDAAKRALAVAELAAGNAVEAQRHARAVYGSSVARVGPEGYNACETEVLLAETLAALRRDDEARVLANDVLIKTESAFGADYPLARRARATLKSIEGRLDN